MSNETSHHASGADCTETALNPAAWEYDGALPPWNGCGTDV